MPKYNLIIIGIDPSYSRCGITIAGDKEIIHSTSINYKANQASTSKRKQLEAYLIKLLDKAIPLAPRIAIIYERLRTFSSGNKIRPNYLISMGALVSRIIDVASLYSIPVFSVDTRAWKTQIVGTNKPLPLTKLDALYPYANKLPTLEYVKKKYGIDCSEGVNCKGRPIFNDDKADSICIAMYGFLPKEIRKLKLETF